MKNQIQIEPDIILQNGFLSLVSWISGDHIHEKKHKKKRLILATNTAKNRVYFFSLNESELKAEKIKIDCCPLFLLGKIRSIHWQKDTKKVFVHDFTKPGSLYSNKDKSIFCVTAKRQLWTVENGFN